MDAMLALVWARRGDVLNEKRIGVMDAYFLPALKTEFEKFKASKKGQGTFPWSRTIRNYVRGACANRFGKLCWLVDVDVVYAVLNVGNNHWVSVEIDLTLGTFTVFDSCVNLNSEAKMRTYLKSYLEAMPILLKDLSKAGIAFPAAFVYAGRPSVYQNERGGDCGPVSVKFIELHSQDLELKDLTDANVDDFRWKYAVDIFEEYEEPVFNR